MNFRIPPSKPTTLIFIGVLTFLQLILVPIWVFVPPEVRSLPLAVILGLDALIIALLIPHYFAGITVGTDKLKVRALPYGVVSLSKGDIVRAFVVDLKVDKSYGLSFRVAGTAGIGFNSGWFRLKNKAKALILSARRENLVLETRLGYYIILGPYEFKEFLGAFKLFHKIEE